MQHSNMFARFTLLSVAVLLAILAIGRATSVAEEKSSGKLYVVEMYDFYFDPLGLFLQPGDRVAWIMLEDHLADGHSATAYHPQYDKELRIPEQAEAWTSEVLKKIGEAYA